MTIAFASLPTEITDHPAATLPSVKPKIRFDSVQPVLEKLFELYPHLFGERFLPLKLGVFHDILAAHPDVFKREELKAALGFHTRSVRYLQSVVDGNARHDLQGQVVEPVLPWHRFQSIVTLYRRRQGRTQVDLRPELCQRLASAYQASGLSPQEYLTQVRLDDEAISAVLGQAMDQVDQQRAKQAALVRAFDASGKTELEFADIQGIPLCEVQAALKRRSLSTGTKPIVDNGDC